MKQSLRYVSKLGSLTRLRLGFDAGNHFRSYENLAFFNVDLVKTYKQNVTTHYLVEKHGKGPDDSEIFSPCRRWLKECLMKEDAFIDTEFALAEAFREGAERDMRAYPRGTTFIIEVLDVPAERPGGKELIVPGAFVNRKYCVESVYSRVHDTVELRDLTFSDSTTYNVVGYTIATTAGGGAWRRGFWQNPTWAKPAVKLGEEN